MSVNQSGLRRTVGKHETDAVSKGIRAADLIAGAFYLGLNIIGALGEFTKVFASYSNTNSGIVFLYKTLCYPAAFAVSRFLSLSGDMIYVWIIAQMVFFLSAFLLWLVIIMIRGFFRIIF